MKNTKDLLKEAIADAKAVRETALQQAKLALEEAFTPKLQSMFSARLKEAYDENEEELDETTGMDYEGDTTERSIDDFTDNTDYTDSMDEIDLDEILAELDNELNEAENEDEEAEDAEAETEEAEEIEDEDEKEVKDLSMDELEDLIKSIIDQETGGAGDEIENHEDETGDGVDLSGDMGSEDFGSEEENLEEELDAILAELMADDKDEIEEAKNKVEDEDKKKIEEDLKLALETVNTLRTELNEVNLLNAKLLYVNKIFKAKNLNESQKLKVVRAFDKAGTAKDAKLIYESLFETFNSVTQKSPLKESLGFASKSAGVATKPLIVEGNDFITRMQKLANIK
jgi:hypothetical protein